MFMVFWDVEVYSLIDVSDKPAATIFRVVELS
jgi:hypothetical protein